MRKSPTFSRLKVHLIMILTLISVIAIVQKEGQAQPEPGWRTFIEPDFGFQIDYPANWYPRLVVDNVSQAGYYGEEVALRSIGFFGPNSQIVFVDVWHNQSNLSLSQWMERYPSPLAADSSLLHSAAGATIEDRPAFYSAYLPARPTGPQLLDFTPRAPTHHRTQFQRGELVYAIEYAAPAPDLATYQSMLNSFKSGTRNSFNGPNAIPKRAASLSTELPPAQYGITTATCCNVTDPEYNPFPCNTAGDATCPYPPCGNCTWWARYRRLGGTVANLSRCTGDSYTWNGCVDQYYPSLVSALPETNAVVLYPTINHLSFVEQANGGSTYSVSDLSWYDSCPAKYYTSGVGGGKRFVLHPDMVVPNEPPNIPSPQTPADDSWQSSKTLTLKWTDQGDPDDSPQPYRNFFATIWNDDWNKHSSWIINTEWEVAAPDDGGYAWQVKASDGIAESGWSATQQVRVDTSPPQLSAQTLPPVGRWYNTEQSISWTALDPAPGIGTDYFKWAWDDDTPNNQINGENGAITLSSAGQGTHNFYLQAWDKLGNASDVTSWGWWGYDTVAPTISYNPANPLSGRWYNTPRNINWTATDPAPGIGGAKSSWIWDTPDARSGAEGQTEIPQLQGQFMLTTYTWDALGNLNGPQTQGWFGYDSLIPTPPKITVACNAPNNQWQTTCNAPAFSWAANDVNLPDASEELTYAYGWSSTPTVTLGAFSGQTSFTPPVSVTLQSKMYLHVQARDGAGNLSSPASYGFWYGENFSSTLVLTDTTPNTFYIRLNDDALFTNIPTVTVSAWGPNLVEGKIGVNPAPITAAWQALPLSATWVLSGAESYFTPRRLYAWFRDNYGPYFDEIIYDPVHPRGRIRWAKTPSVLSITAWDDNSGIAAMRLNAAAVMTATVWQPFTHTVTYTAGHPVVYVQFLDKAGNLSPVYGTDGSNSSLTEKVYLPLIWR